MSNEFERRKHKRLPIELQLSINKMFRQNNEVIDNLDASVKVIDISKSGMGFVSKAVLPLDFYFDGKIVLDNKDFFYAVIKIVRIRNWGTDSDEYFYGCEFVGLAPFLANKIDTYGEHVRL